MNILGIEPNDWAAMLDTQLANKANKAINYYNGQQEEEVRILLDQQYKNRHNWTVKGILPRFRDVTRMVVEKSGLLFKDTPPKFELFDANSDVPNTELTKAINKIFYDADWLETFQNFDSVVRLLKTGLILTQHNPLTGNLFFQILHRGNSEIKVDPATGEIIGLIYITDHNKNTTEYRIFTKETIYDLVKQTNTKEVTVTHEPNTYKVVPVTPFYDTRTPISGNWVESVADLVTLNEMVNLHLSESEFSISWQKISTPVTNAKIVNQANSSASPMMNQNFGSNPQLQPTNQLGHTNLIELDGEDVMFEFKSPNVDLLPLENILNGWVRDYANDWSVNIKSAGEGTANSGFQLVVEEINNLDLRKVRQRQCEHGMKRLFRVIKQVLKSINKDIFPEDSTLFVKFAKPRLPIDNNAEEETWTTRINEMRATPVEYLMEVQGLEEEEAVKKFEKTLEFFKKYQLNTTLLTQPLESKDGTSNTDGTDTGE